MDALATTTAIDDTIKTSMYDAICDAEGHASAFFLKHHLAKRGLVIVEAARHDKLLTTLQFVGSVLEPFTSKMERVEAAYRRRGGNPDTFGDKHPSFDVTAEELPLGVWRALRGSVTRIKESLA